ncbi:MAG: beta strand repeat-containing protein, partial [Planctomycetota bacterium]
DVYIWNDGDGSDSIIGDIGHDLLEVNTSTTEGDTIAVLPDGVGFIVQRDNLVPFTITVNLGISVHLNTLGGDDTMTIGDLSGVFNFEFRSFELDGGTGNDTIDVQALTGGPEAFIHGDDGDDTVIASTGPLGNDGMADFVNIGLSALPSRHLGYSLNGTTAVFSRAAGAGNDAIIVNGTGDDDSLTIDYVNGSPVARGPIFFNGGDQQAGGDNLTLIDGTVTSVTHNFTNASDGTIEIEDSGTETITYTGLEPIFDNLSATDRIFNFGATDDDITLSDLGGGLSRIESVSSSETVDFVNPSGSLTVNADDGADTINYDSLATTAAVRLNAGDGTDTVNVFGTTAGSSTTVNGGLASDTVNVGSAGNSLDGILGDVTVNGDDHDVAPTVTLGANTLEQGDVLNINDQGNATGVTYAIAATSVTRTGAGSITYGTVESLNLNAGLGDDTVNAATTADSVNTTLNGGDGADTVSLTTNGATASVSVNGDAGDDTISYAATGAASATLIDGGADNDTVTGTGSGDNVTILGGTGDDSLTGGSGDDSISGEDGADAIAGGQGGDTLSGGNDDDVLVWNDGDGDDRVDGDDGTDRQIVNAADNAAEGDSITVSDNGARIDITRAAGTMLGTFTLDVGTTEIVEVNSLAGDDTIDASGLTNGAMDVNAGDGLDTITGGSQNDTLAGNSGNDVILGGDGDDILRGGANSDTLNGQAGNDLVEGQGGIGDQLTGEAGDDTLDGGASDDDIVVEVADQDFELNNDSLTGLLTGTDVLIGIELADLTGGASGNMIAALNFDGRTTLQGLDGPDTIIGGTARDVILGGGGDDSIEGHDGDDFIDAGAGSNFVLGGDGDDRIYGGAGNDTLGGESGRDRVLGLGGDDLMFGGPGFDSMRGGAGRDTLNGEDGNDNLFGQGGSGDVLQGGLGNDALDGGSGNDRVFESADTDFTLRRRFLIGGTTGTDSLTSIETAQLEGGASANLINADGWLNFATLNGVDGNDTIVGSRGGSLINGGNGDDTIIAGRSADTINGNAGNDDIDAGRSDDVVNGGEGDDLINGGRGADTLRGDAGDDRIFGVTSDDYPHEPVQPQLLETVNNTDADSLLGGNGNDTIAGGLGSDFVDGQDGADTIDVTSGGDGIDGIDTVVDSLLDAIFRDPTDLLI